MKTLGRILIIVAATLVVVGAAVAIVRMGGAQSLASGSGEEGRPGLGDQRQFDGGGVPDSFGEGGDRREGGVFGLVGLFKNLLIVGAIALAVVLVSKLIESFRKRGRRNPSAPA